MVDCWPKHQMDPLQVPAHAAKLSTGEQATCIQKQGQDFTSFTPLAVVGGTSACTYKSESESEQLHQIC